MVLLDRVIRSDGAGIVCAARSHLDPANPLRHDGRLAAVCGVEYALQAAAVHGALLAGGAAGEAGYAASFRGVALHVQRLDDASFGDLAVEARLETRETFGMVYEFAIRSAVGARLVAGRFSIALRRG